MTEQLHTPFSSGIEKVRCQELYDTLMKRFYDLEEGELLDIKYYDDYNFYCFLSDKFKRKYLKYEGNQVYSFKKIDF